MARLSRRQFLAAGAAGTAGVALAREASVLGGTQKPWNDATGRALHKYRDPQPTVCTLCPAQCAVAAYRDGDRVVQLGANAAAGPLGAVCARAFQALESLYDPERVLKPLRREGKRGEGKWREISWTEALRLVAEGVAKAPHAAYADLGRPDPLAGPLLEALGIRNVIEDAAARRWGALRAQNAVYGTELGRPDVSKARTLVLFGASPLDDDPHYALLARDLVQAKARGTAVLAIGSYEGVTGSLASEWIPVRPGTEALVALALVRVALTEGWFDAGALTRAVGSSAPALLQELLACPLDFVESAAGIPVLDLVRLARRLAHEGPTLCLADSAGTRGAENLEAAVAVLCCLWGDPEGAGLRLAHTPDFVPRLTPTLPRTRVLKDILAENAQASVYLAYRSNPLYRIARSESVRKAFAGENHVGLLVALDTQLTETAAMADLVLPAAADLELWNLLGGYTPEGKPFALLQQPAVHAPTEAHRLKNAATKPEALFDGAPGAPLGEARQLGDVLLGVLEGVNPAARSRFPENCAAAVRTLAAAGPFAAGAGTPGLAASGVWVGESATYPWASKKGFPTKGGKLAVAGKLAHEIPADLRQLGGDAFALVVLRHPELAAGYANSRWGREIRFRNPLVMNAGAARRLGLSAGDRAWVRTGAGEAEVEVLPIQGIHPQAVGLAEDFGHWAGGVAATAKTAPTGDEPETLLVRRRAVLSSPLGLSRQQTRPGETPWWHEHGPGTSVWALSPFTSDEAGAQAWREIRVTVRKA